MSPSVHSPNWLDWLGSSWSEIVTCNETKTISHDKASQVRMYCLAGTITENDLQTLNLEVFTDGITTQDNNIQQMVKY